MADQPEEKGKATAEEKARLVWDRGAGTPALPGGPCLTPPHPDWSDNKKWGWDGVCAGRVNGADGKTKSPALNGGNTGSPDENNRKFT